MSEAKADGDRRNDVMQEYAKRLSTIMLEGSAQVKLVAASYAREGGSGTPARSKRPIATLLEVAPLTKVGTLPTPAATPVTVSSVSPPASVAGSSEQKLRERVHDLLRRLRRSDFEHRSRLIVARADPRTRVTASILDGDGRRDEAEVQKLLRDIEIYDQLVPLWT